MAPVLALVAALVLAAPAAGQNPRQVTAEEALAAAREAYGPRDTRAQSECRAIRKGDEIVVCGRQEDDARFRAQSSSDLDPTGAGARGGIPHAPDVGTAYPGSVAARGCFVGPCPPPMPALIDLKAIPEAPPGSDADRIARGERPQ